MDDLEGDIQVILMVRSLTDLLHDQTNLIWRMEQWVLDHKTEIEKVFPDKTHKVSAIRRCMKNIIVEMAVLIASSPTRPHEPHDDESQKNDK